MKERRVLVTGATGFIGSELVLSLVERGYAVLALSRNEINTEVSSRLAKLPRVVHQTQDLVSPFDRQEKFCELIDNFRIAAVFHCAAESSAEKCERDVALARKINSEASRDLAESCKLKDVPLIFFSTDMIFSEPPIYPDGRFTENDIPNPQGAYPESKREAELAVLAYRRGYVLRNALTLGIARLAPQQGPLAKMLCELDAAHQQRQSAEPIASLRYLEAFADEWRTPISLNQLIESCLALLEICQSRQVPQILNMAGKDRLSRYDMGLVIAENFGFSADLVRPTSRSSYKGRFNRPIDCSLSGALAEAVLGVPSVSLKEGLKSCSRRSLRYP